MYRNSEKEKEYFREAVALFNHHRWIYKAPVTQLLFKGSLDLTPADWLHTLESLDNEELNRFVAKFEFKEHWPNSLKTFIEKCKRTNRMSNLEIATLELPKLFLKKLSPKKQHEIFQLSKVIHSECEKLQISTIIDLGAGLGYICQLLHFMYGYKVLGIESNSKNVETAQNRQKQSFPESLQSVKYVCYEISKTSSETIQHMLTEEFKDSKRVCLIGLHACGDLGPHMMKIYSEMNAAQLLILVSCCYHKITYSSVEEGKEYFNNFPMSAEFKGIIESENVDIGDIFGRTFLRLASQESPDRWNGMDEKTHVEHSFYVLARAVLELYAAQKNLTLKKLVQKATRKSQCVDFATYLKDCVKRYSLHTTSGEDVLWNLEIENSIVSLWNEYANKQKSTEIYTGLQLLLQSPAESLVLFDRLCWLQERNFDVELVSVANKVLSPRSQALIARKMEFVTKEKD